MVSQIQNATNDAMDDGQRRVAAALELDAGRPVSQSEL